MCTIPMCCVDPCTTTRILPYGHGPDSDPLSGFPTGSGSNVQTETWSVASTANGEYAGGRVEIPDGSIPPMSGVDTVTASYRAGINYLSENGIDGVYGDQSQDREFWFNQGANQSLALSPTIQGCNFVQFTVELDLQNGIGFYSNGSVSFDADCFLLLPEVQITGESGTSNWRVRYDNDTSSGGTSVTPGVVRLTFQHDPLSTDTDGTVSAILEIGSTSFTWTTTSQLFYQPIILGVQKTSGLSGDTVAELTSFAFRIGNGNETLVHENVAFESKASTWTGGTNPAWSKTIDSVPRSPCFSPSFPVARKEVVTSVSVTPNTLYRIQLVMGPAQLVGSSVVGPSLPTLIVDNKPVRLYVEDEGGEPLYHPGQVGYYYRAYYPVMELAMVANPNTSGQILGVNIWEVGQEFAINYPFQINTDSIGKNFFNWLLSSTPINIVPIITGGVPPYQFELVNPGLDSFSTSLPGFLNPITGVIEGAVGGGNTPFKGMVKATDSNGLVAYSYRFKWQ